MEPIYICFYESRDHTYAGFGTTPEEAKKVCLKGYRTVCKRVSGETLDKDGIREFNDDSFIEEVKMGKCLIDEGRQGWF